MRSLLMILMLALCAQADAGPLRERLAERRAAAAGAVPASCLAPPQAARTSVTAAASHGR